MTVRSGLIVLAALAVAAGTPPSASAHAPGRWTRVTDSTASNLREVTLARTGDGRLHVAWTRPSPSHPHSQQDLLNRIISPVGLVGPPTVIESGWSTIQNPALVATGGNGLDLFAGAIRSLASTETITNLAFLNSTDDGSTWKLQETDVTKKDSAYSSDVSAALGQHGIPFEAWGSSDCLCVHRGTDSSTPNMNFQRGLGDFGYEPGMAVDPATSQLVVAWYSNATGHSGVYAATVDQTTGARVGTPVRMPGTASLADGPFSGRTQMVGRPGGGVYVAYEAGYPSHTKVLLWRTGAARSTVMAHERSDVHSVGLADTPSGRLWIFWATNSDSGTPIIRARRSNESATNWGTAVTLRPPHGASTSWNLVGSGQSGSLDLFGSFSIGSSSNAATWYTQVLPGLTVGASPRRLRRGTHHAQAVKFSVSDAGVPLGGAKVSVDHRTGLTNGYGQVTLALGPFAHRTRLTAHVTATGYTTGSVTLKVR